MKPIIRTTAVVAALGISGFALAACSGSSTSPSSSSPAPTSASASSSTIGGGEAACTEGQLTADVNTLIKASGGKVTKVQSFKCAKGWAYVVASTKTANGPDITGVYVFQAEGPYWINADLKVACGTSQSNAKIPADLYVTACKTTF
ncbi:MAG: hypothetical protein WCP28_17960 [Actinomycetes bacterium]